VTANRSCADVAAASDPLVQRTALGLLLGAIRGMRNGDSGPRGVRLFGAAQ
jgi:hypothetical protein